MPERSEGLTKEVKSRSRNPPTGGRRTTALAIVLGRVGRAVESLTG